MNNIIFEVGDIVEVVGPVLNMPYRGLFKVSVPSNASDLEFTDYVGLIDLPDPLNYYPMYICKVDFLYKIPSEDLPFKLLAHREHTN